jgi:hypothetical protein
MIQMKESDLLSIYCEWLEKAKTLHPYNSFALGRCSGLASAHFMATNTNMLHNILQTVQKRYLKQGQIA